MSVHDENEFKKEIDLWQKGVTRELHEMHPPKELDQFVSDLPQMAAAQKTKRVLFLGIAAILLASITAPLLYSNMVTSPQDQKSISVAGDMNGDAQINMVDAFLLHKKLQEQASFANDLNGDGFTDELDVSWIAENSVKAGLL